MQMIPGKKYEFTLVSGKKVVIIISGGSQTGGLSISVNDQPAKDFGSLQDALGEPYISVKQIQPNKAIKFAPFGCQTPAARAVYGGVRRLEMRDSYLNFFSKGYISKEQFFDFGLSETIYVDFGLASQAWEYLKLRIHGNKPVYIRGFGRDARGTLLFQSLYRYAYGNQNILKDATNNAEPTKLMREWTGFSKNGGSKYQAIRNYQISHVFGRTKNPYCFTAPWNIVYIPKIIDPFTGHEAKGDFVDEFTRMFQQQCYSKFGALIDDFNQLVTPTEFQENIETALQQLQIGENVTDKDMAKLRKSIESEFSPIEQFA